MPKLTLLILVCVVAATSNAFAQAEAPAIEEGQLKFFEQKIRPVLVTHCYECHSAGSKKIGGDLLLDSREGVAKGGESGPVIMAGRPDDSPLIKAIRYDDDVNNLPSLGELFRPLDGKQLDRNQSHLGMKRDLIRCRVFDDRASLPLQVDLNNSVALQVMAKQFRKYVEALDSFQSHANMPLQCALI